MDSPGQLYLADQRGLIETQAYRRLMVFNQGHYQADGRQPFGPLGMVNDTLLAAAESMRISTEHNGYTIILPITGEVLICDSVNRNAHADAGDAYICYQKAGSSIELINPYDRHWINFLQLHIQAESNTVSGQTMAFDLASQPNQLIDIFKDDTLPFALHIGIFEGRQEALYQLKSMGSRLFAFVLTGAFELQGRLLHEGDSLALWNLHEADMEALSNNAVIAVLEMC